MVNAFAVKNLEDRIVKVRVYGLYLVFRVSLSYLNNFYTECKSNILFLMKKGLKLVLTWKSKLWAEPKK